MNRPCLGLVLAVVAVACWYMTCLGRQLLRMNLPAFRPGVALAMLALNAMTMEHAYGWIFGARDEVNIRPVSDWATEEGRGVIPFTTYAAEKQAIMDALPCKWISQGGEDSDGGVRKADGEARYDFLCKGGNWATVSLLLDTAPGYSNGLARVRLIWREWPQNVHPGGGEAFVARLFLKHVADRLVPADLSQQVQDAYFARRSRSWWAGKVLHMRYTSEDNRTHVVHRLEIAGLARAVTSPGALLPVVVQPAKAVPARVKPASAAEKTGLVAPTPTPVEVPNLKPLNEPVIPLPVPAPAEAGSLSEPGPGTPLALPPAVKMPEAAVSPALVPALPSDFSAQPDPDSLKQDAAPPPVSTTMVPDAQDVLRGRPGAPTNFDAYNKAEALTRQFESKAMIKPNEGNKVVSATGVAPTDVQSQSGLAKDAPAPSVPAVPTPEMAGTGADTPQAATQEGAKDPAAEPRFEPSRPLPQLRFVPKARPVERPDKVIQFEDEKSAL